MYVVAPTSLVLILLLELKGLKLFYISKVIHRINTARNYTFLILRWKSFNFYRLTQKFLNLFLEKLDKYIQNYIYRYTKYYIAYKKELNYIYIPLWPLGRTDLEIDISIKIRLPQIK